MQQILDIRIPTRIKFSLIFRKSKGNFHTDGDEKRDSASWGPWDPEKAKKNNKSKKKKNMKLINSENGENSAGWNLQGLWFEPSPKIYAQIWRFLISPFFPPSVCLGWAESAADFELCTPISHFNGKLWEGWAQTDRACSRKVDKMWTNYVAGQCQAYG